MKMISKTMGTVVILGSILGVGCQKSQSPAEQMQVQPAPEEQTMEQMQGHPTTAEHAMEHMIEHPTEPATEHPSSEHPK
jgi:PBP1b-binding outer membrane lipoprotein LpoB